MVDFSIDHTIGKEGWHSGFFIAFSISSICDNLSSCPALPPQNQYAITVARKLFLDINIKF
jgi:hypothetical protein